MKIENIQKTYSKYIDNYYNVKYYTSDKYKLTLSKRPVLRPGFDHSDEKTRTRDVNDDKLENNLSRAKSRVFEYAECNKFDLFVTLTLDKEKYNRYDLKQYIKDLGQFIRNYRRDFDCNIQYLLIPEQHKDSAWHMHGLIKGIPEEHLREFTLNEKLPVKMRELLIKGHRLYDWEAYRVKFGFISMEPVRSQEAVSKYITKYITKSVKMGKGVKEKEAKLYYVSRGLKKPQKIREGSLSTRQIEKIAFDFENDHVKTRMMSSKDYEKINDILTLIY